MILMENFQLQNQSLVKARDEAGLKKHSTEVHKFIEELVKIGPIFFIFEKVSTFIVTEEKVEEVPPKTEEETSGVKDREIVVEEEKKEEISEKIESVDENVERKAKAAEDIAPPPADKQEEKPVEPTAVEQAEPPKA
ncbi:plasma membrane-associated cation-binding protein [Trifolium pratense]|uniref:Plasma membrane-associated cation-binding protein n=1 Tax=Trifolium pratense TaxID=57577 RepID=A0A2K3MAL2_TRIPR|nr:plasma membrane-associated cation-binding protein [Trifolium pratense]